MLNEVSHNTEQFIGEMPKDLRKEYGQFFTSKETARYMASMFNVDKDQSEINILDAGAGSGILSIAFLEKCNDFLSEGNIVHLVCYENDENILPLLKSNLELAMQNCRFGFDYEIRNENYILSQKSNFQPTLFDTVSYKKFDYIIGNPPYKKIGKDAPEAKAMEQVCYGAPNLYFLFMSMGIANLKNGSELVYIIPRSWTSGAYFERFRQYLFSNCVITDIHLFESRDKVFDKESVLQETMILKVRKTIDKPESISVTTSNSNSDFENITLLKVPYNVVVSDINYYVRLVTDESEVRILELLSRFKDTLLDLGLRMKTGLVVDFRARELLKENQDENTIPLIYSQHIREGRVRFPNGKGTEYLLKDRQGLMQVNKNYLFLKRFTSKEESRRLQCGIYLKRYLPDFEYISSQNKVNFIDGLQELSECVVYGLFVLFNSKIYDMYYRILNGSTQVNSSEINAMPVPSMPIIEKMGKDLLKNKDLSVENCDTILNQYLYE
ncbi:MAG: Eco57I restriction-modification methylase domain-containing protein [Bacteroidales bacterium]|nr:Eco57I restriction-modification methylase domain-containing protein [Bacteroidales bacterium]